MKREKAIKDVGDSSIKYPRSFFIKGPPNLLKNIRIPLIVKSCSNTRSRVVAKDQYSKWNKSNLHNLPTLFQEKIDGADIRVHVCQNTLWSLLVSSKDSLDYRYSSRGSVSYQSIDLPPSIQRYCQTIAALENNIFIGVDLMLCGQNYFCLESNPGPGWSTYHHPSKKEFSHHLFSQLQNIE